MAHRGPLRELFGLLCLTLIFPKSEKSTKPISNTGYIIDHDDSHSFYTSNIITAPPTPGFLPFLIAWLIPDASTIIDGLLEVILALVSHNGLFPCLTTIKRAFSLIFILVTRLLQVPNHRRRAPVADAEEPLPAPEEIPIDVPASENAQTLADLQALADLRAESAGKDARIATLSKTAKESSDRFAAVYRQNTADTRRLRAALDPEDRMEPTTSLVGLANRVHQQLKTVTRKMTKLRDDLRKANKAKDEALKTAEDLKATLETEGARPQVIDDETANLDKKARDEAAKEAAKKLEESEKKVEAEAARVTELQGELEESEKKVEAEAARITELQGELEEARKEAEELRTTAAEKVGVAEKKAEEEATTVAELKQDLATSQGEAEELRNTAARVGTAETTATELQRKLKEARDEANEEHRSNERLIAELVRTQEAVKQQEREGSEIARLQSELDEAHNETEEAREQVDEAYKSGFTEAMTQKSQVPNDQSEQVADPVQQHGSGIHEVDEALQNQWREQGYQMAESDYKNQGRLAIEQAVENERLDAAERQRVAVAQKEQELRALFQQEWNDQVAQWSTASDTELQNMTPDGVRYLQGQLRTATQRAIAAERKVNNPDGEIKEARDIAITLRDKGQEQWQRAEAAEQRANDAEDRAQTAEDRAQTAEARAETAEEAVKKYRNGKITQDGQLANAQRELTEAKKHRLSDLKIAEMAAAEHERDRALALTEESISRHYDSATRDVVRDLMNANSRIRILQIKLLISTTQSNQNDFLESLSGADIDAAKVKALYLEKRLVLVRQCAAVNAKLVALRTIIKANKKPDKERLLLEIFKPRGDEETRWDDQEDAESTESDEDDDEDDDEDGGSGGASGPSPPTAPTTPDNPLKRKDDSDHKGSDRSGKKYDPIGMGMRPIDPKAFTFNTPSNVASVAVTPTQAPPTHERIFSGLPLLVAAQAANASTPPSLPPPEDQVLEFESSAVTEEGQGSSSEPDFSAQNFELPDATPALNYLQNLRLHGRDVGAGGNDGEYQSHTIGDDDEEEEKGIVWENVLDRDSRDDGNLDLYFDYERYANTSPGNEDDFPDTESSPVQALDMTEQNYAEQEAEFAAAMHGIEQAPPRNEGQPQAEELEDTFHVDLD